MYIRQQDFYLGWSEIKTRDCELEVSGIGIQVIYHMAKLSHQPSRLLLFFQPSSFFLLHFLALFQLLIFPQSFYILEFSSFLLFLPLFFFSFYIFLSFLLLSLPSHFEDPFGVGLDDIDRLPHAVRFCHALKI